jgi:hypothetical protein
MAVEPFAMRRRLETSPRSDGRAGPDLDRHRRCSIRARRFRMACATGPGGRADGHRASRPGLSLPVPVRAQRQAAKPVDRPTVAQTIPAALEWQSKDYPIP